MIKLPIKIGRIILLWAMLFISYGCTSWLLPNHHELSMPLLKSAGFFNKRIDKSELPMVTLQLGMGKLLAEIASTPMQAASGLAFRTTLAPNRAMLFTYPAPHKVIFYMKDTYLPLSIAYIDSMGNILEIHDMIPGAENRVTSQSEAVRFVLEVNRGWFERYNVTIGDRIYVEK